MAINCRRIGSKRSDCNDECEAIAMTTVAYSVWFVVLSVVGGRGNCALMPRLDLIGIFDVFDGHISAFMIF
jgi:hypothetical protein